MNYHLKLLEGIIERDKNRFYRLTPIGRKAFMILNSMTEDLENGYEDYLGKARQSHSTWVLKLANIYFIIFAILSFSAIGGLWLFMDTGIGAGKISSSSMIYVYGIILLTFIGLFFIRGWVNKNAENVQELFNRIIGRFNKR